MKKTLHVIDLNLQQGLVHYNEPHSVNTVIAIFDRHQEKVVIRPEYKSETIDIVILVGAYTGIPRQNLKVTYNDGFRVDTWDNELYPRQAAFIEDHP